MNLKNVHNFKLAAKEYKMEIRKAKSIYHKSLVHKLQSSRSNDPKTFWTMIHKKNKRVNNNNVSVDVFFDHFSKLNDKNETVDETCSDSFVLKGRYPLKLAFHGCFPSLDGFIWRLFKYAHWLTSKRL